MDTNPLSDTFQKIALSITDGENMSVNKTPMGKKTLNRVDKLINKFTDNPDFYFIDLKVREDDFNSIYDYMERYKQKATGKYKGYNFKITTNSSFEFNLIEIKLKSNNIIPNKYLGKPLSKSEEKITTKLKSGLSRKQIAKELGKSFFTIDTQIKKIYKKLGVKTELNLMVKLLKEKDN